MKLFWRKAKASPLPIGLASAQRLKGKVCLVTGAAAGIGLGIADMCAREGATVIMADINADEVQSAAHKLSAEALSVEPLHHDAGDEQSWRDALRRVMNLHGRLDVLVNNAASGWAATLEETTLEDWRRINRVTNDGVFIGTKLAIEQMGQSGVIVNIASIAGIKGSVSALAYATAKAAVITFTRSIAMHCAKQGKQIRVNAIAPGLIQTAGLDGVVKSASKGNSLLLPVIRKKMTEAVPLGYLGEPADVAHAAVYLASDGARYVTGQVLSVDGGFTAN